MTSPLRPAPQVSAPHKMTILGAHQIAAGALLAQPAHVKVILGTLAMSDGGSPVGAENANLLDAVSRLQVRAQFVSKWRGAAAAQRILFPAG